MHFCDRTEEGGGTLQMLSLANKKFYDLATIELYKDVRVSVPAKNQPDIGYPGIERLAKTFVRNLELGQHIESLYVKFDRREPGVARYGHLHERYDITPNSTDYWMLKKLTGRIANFPIFSEFPMGNGSGTPTVLPALVINLS